MAATRLDSQIGTSVITRRAMAKAPPKRKAAG